MYTYLLDFWFVFVWDTASKVYNVTNFRDTFVSRPFLIKLWQDLNEVMIFSVIPFCTLKHLCIEQTSLQFCTFLDFSV